MYRKMNSSGVLKSTIVSKNMNSLVKIFEISTKRMLTGSMIPKPMEKVYYIGDKPINVLRVGTGRNVMFFPGLLGTIWTDFTPQISDFNLNKFCLTVWDPPGHGKSRPPDKDYTTKFYEEDAFMASKLIELLEIKSCSLLGWSDGGITALIVAAKYPDLIDKLVIWGTNSYINGTDLNIYKNIQNISKWSTSMRQPFVDIYGEVKLQILMDKWIDGLSNYYHNRNGDVCARMLGSVLARTLILHGEKDPLVPLFHAKYMYERIQLANLHTFPDGKHNIHMKYAKEFNQIVQKFLLDI